MEWIVQLPILLFSVMIHEIAHGLMALRHGDDTAKRAGRFTLNPVPHIDPFGTVFLPLLCVISQLPLMGWARPVPVNPSRLGGSRRWPMFQVALVGPVSNLALSLAAALLFRSVASMPGFFPQYQKTLLNALFFAVSINLFLAYFNLIPIHPLDGGNLLSSLLSPRLRTGYERHRPYGFLIIMGLALLGFMGPIILGPARWTLRLLESAGLIW
ncbi:MAG: site-2 protease family protein [Elusimicrobia bacterium]|nr:site-2 protease family protein [Elusimicrobiota bacterium]